MLQIIIETFRIIVPVLIGLAVTVMSMGMFAAWTLGVV